MKVKIRTVDGVIKTLDVSKAMLVQNFRKLVFESTGIEPKKQRLLFRGKQMENGCDLLDYRVEIGTIIDVTERVVLEEVDTNSKKNKSSKDKSSEKEDPPKFSEEREPDDPKPSASSSSSTAADEASKNLDKLRELCPELAEEVQQEQQKEEICKKCKNDPKKKCKECGCTVCGGKEDEDKQLFCEQCEYVTHMWCLDPPLEAIPEDDWYCPDCKNDANEIVQAGELGNKYSHRQSKMPSRQNTGTKRDWGKGLATAGRTKTCNIVPKNHFGPIPGIDVGMCWKFRIQVSEEGVHRPPVGGIAGRAAEGCQSIVLAGGYEDDIDDGFEFVYTGSGGRDLSGNKRTAEQSSDQVLDKMNLAIAMNCHATVDKVNGAEAKDWKKGKPIRVVRSAKLKKHSKFAPEEGNRYDGIYKVVKYWPEKGRSGFLVWRYLLRRDDPSPAPWEEGAKKFECIGLPDDDDENKDKPAAKKIKLEKFVVDVDLRKLIEEDGENAALWKTCLDFDGDKKAWYDNVQEVFGCVICFCLLEKPVTLPCKHNVCLGCLERSFKAEVYTCPYCRHELGKDYEKVVNEACEAALKKLFTV